jgi:hypothetical protein
MIVSISGGTIAYYHAPKCASRTILAWAVLLEEPHLLAENPDWFAPSRYDKEYREIRQRVRLFKESEHDWERMAPPVVPAKIRFCVVRDPVERFLSGFTNRILFHRRAPVTAIGNFIEHFDEIAHASTGVRNHFKPQVCFYGRDPSLFTHVFRMTELGQIKHLLERSAGVQLPDLHLQQSGGALKPTLTTAQLDWVREKYKDDYAALGAWL